MIRTMAGLLAGTALLAGAIGAQAADLPLRSAPVFAPPPPIFTWTGAYFGINAGYAFTDNDAIRTAGNNGPGAGALIGPANTNTVANVATNRRPARFSNDQDGFTGGGQIGYNFQFGGLSGVVFGIEADAQYTDLEQSRRFLSALNDPSTFRQGIDFIGTVRGRLGYAFDRLLVYGTGGFAYGDVTTSARFFSNAAGNPLAYAGGNSGIKTGYTYGGGLEYAMPTDSFLNFFRSSAVTIKAEYLRYDLGTTTVLVNQVNAAPSGSYTSRFDTEGSLVRAGLNFKFGGL